MLNQKPFISLVIPTRERSETLFFTLQTALNQTHENYEIIVSDNFSQDNTKQVVNSFCDSRIKYINTQKRLSMCENWDFAFEHVKGEYVIYIGDDDAILPGAIKKLQLLIEKSSYEIYFWQPHDYRWPINHSKSLIEFVSPKIKPYKMNLKKLAKFAIQWGGWRYHTLPLGYHSAVSTQILKKIKNKTGKVFHSTCPDVFLGFALPVFTTECIHIGESLTVNGRSAKSNGGSIYTKVGMAIHQKFLKEYDNYKMHKTIPPFTPCPVNASTDSILVAMDLFPDYYDGIHFNYSAMWAYLRRTIAFDNKQRKKIDCQYGEVPMGRIREILKIKNKIKTFHPFNSMKFVIYSFIHSFFEFKKQISRNKLKSKECPDNINDFVIWFPSHPISK